MIPVCSVCEGPMSEENARGFEVPVPQIGKKLTFRICPVCQEIAKTKVLYICLWCKALRWELAEDHMTSEGVRWQIKPCENCRTMSIRRQFVVPIF